PSPHNTIVNKNTKEYNYLRSNMVHTLNDNCVSFDFFIQFQTDANRMPIEDPTIPWASQFIKLATLEIPPQQFDTKKQIEFGENLSFNSWHVLPEHRPLGSFNRARKRVYDYMSNYRHKKNGVPEFEPEDDLNFLSDTFKTNKEIINVEVPIEKVISRSAQVTVKCSKQVAFNFISSDEELPNWLKKKGSIPAALYAEKISKTYDFIGAKRKVFFDHNQSTIEELLSFNPYANYSYRITEFTNSLKHFSKVAFSQVWFETVDDKTRITWDYTFKYKNMFSKLMLSFILTFVFKKFMNQSLINAKKYIENGD
ncbi:MAG: SRPBCC family protein, partial [Olleya sp.]